MVKNNPKKRPYGRMMLMGILSISLYAILWLKQETINAYFGRGGMYAFLPIITAFIFSFVHGSFTGDFWTVLGIEAAKKEMKEEMEVE